MVSKDVASKERGSWEEVRRPPSSFLQPPAGPLVGWTNGVPKGNRGKVIYSTDVGWSGQNRTQNIQEWGKPVNQHGDYQMCTAWQSAEHLDSAQYMSPSPCLLGFRCLKRAPAKPLRQREGGRAPTKRANPWIRICLSSGPLGVSAEKLSI